MKSMRILLVSAYFPPTIGGIPTLLDNLIRNMEESGVMFYLLTATSAPVKYANCVHLELPSYAKVRSLTQTYSEVPFEDWRAHKAAIDAAVDMLARDLKGLELDAVFVHTETYASSLLAGRLGIPCVPVIHGVFPTEQELAHNGQHAVRHYANIREGIANMNYHTIYVSEYAKSWWDGQRTMRQSSEIIYNPIDFELFKPRDERECQELRSRLNLPGDAKVVCYPQRPERLGVEFLFGCMEKVIAQHSEVYFLVCGCDDMDKIRKFVRSETLEHNLRCGHFALSEMPLVYSMSDVTVLPARDGFGYPAFESLACGTPIAAVRDSAFAALLCDNEGVALVNNDDANALSGAISAALSPERAPVKKSLLSRSVHDLLDPRMVSKRYYRALQGAISPS